MNRARCFGLCNLSLLGQRLGDFEAIFVGASRIKVFVLTCFYGAKIAGHQLAHTDRELRPSVSLGLTSVRTVANLQASCADLLVKVDRPTWWFTPRWWR